MFVVVVVVGVVESDEFGNSLGGGGYPNEEITEPNGPIETYLSVMTWSVQVVSVLCDVGGGVISSLLLVLLGMFGCC